MIILYSTKLIKTFTMFDVGTDNKNDIIIAAIAKYENDYLEEWVSYHLNLGFDKIYIYDDNPDNYPPISELPVIKKNRCRKVFIIKGGKDKSEYPHLPFYNSFYHTHHFRWCFFIDVDEFITIPLNFRNIKDFLEQQHFENTDVIMFPWKYYGCNNNIKKTDKEVLKRFKKESTKGQWIEEANHTHMILGKCAVRSDIKELHFECTHCPSFYFGYFVITKNANGFLIPASTPLVETNYNSAYIKHFFTKSVEEFVDKIARGYADCKRERPLIEFFATNIMTDKLKTALINIAYEYEMKYGHKFDYTGLL